VFELKAHPVVDPQVRLAATFRAQRERLRGLAYRLTGSAEDAEDVVQEAFVRLMTQAPESVPEVGPWLARVATHLSIDALRRRRRRGYVGPWLPSPAPGAEGEGVEALAAEGPSPEARYGLAESATFAFLIALEVLSPRQRAVLVLRDVLGRSARETAALVDASEGGVRALHLRARRARDAYDASRCIPTPELRRRHRDVLERFLGRLLAQDVAGVESLLT
jgi:RNA polymerase sigma-70 factor (ECF subfamily)